MQEVKGYSAEKKYFLSVLQTFHSYRKQSLLRIEHREECLATLPQHHIQLLEQYKKDLEDFKKAVEINSQFIPIVVEHAKNIFENVYSNDTASHSETDVGTLSEGLDKVQSVFKHLMRDWSTLGIEERNQCYVPILNEIELQFPAVNRSNISVLVPGAGLGRLAFEVASRGFSCQGNEFNLFMLVVSFYVLNHCKKVDEFEMHPWIHQYCNNLSANNQLISARFPDVLPKLSESEENTFSMIAGDFLEVYKDSNEFHCVATCFFIDCAANVVQFIETIFEILKPGGVWINLGPLLYHYSDMKNEQSIEPSFEILCTIIKNIGFVMEKKEIGLKTRYCQNPKAMLQYEYESVYFVCRKPFAVGGHNSEKVESEPHDNKMTE